MNYMLKKRNMGISVKLCYHLIAQFNKEETVMKTFTVRDIREHTGALIHGAEIGKLSLITKHGHPVFLAVPFSEDLLLIGLRPAIAIKLYTEGALTLGKAAKLAGQSIEGFMDRLAHMGIPVVNYNPDEISEELKDFE